MKECMKGQWVEISKVILEAGSRAKGVPEDTACVPLMCWICGWAVTRGVIGQEIEIHTPAGRKVRGILSNVNPSYQHSFGPAVLVCRYRRRFRILLKEMFMMAGLKTRTCLTKV